MFPGRYPAVPDNMWTFWNPQAMGLQGQFCGGDLMNQQSQAQSQAQTQAQLAALGEQNKYPESTTGVTGSFTYPAPSTASSIPPIHVQSTSTSTHNFSA